MGYSFIHLEKVKTNVALARKYAHNYRTTEVSNAYSELKEMNEELVSLNGKNYIEAFNEKKNSLEYYKTRNFRKNQVMAFEVVTTFSREDKELVNLKEWKQDQVDWLRKHFNRCPEKYGDNVVSVMYHGDENGNVHCHAIIIPINDKGRIDSSYYTGGKQMMVDMQNSYGKEMQKKHNLKRGLSGSTARHEDIRKFYASLNAEIAKELPKPKENENIVDYHLRIQKEYEMLNLQKFHIEKLFERAKVEKIHAEITASSIKEEVEKVLGDNYNTAIAKHKTLERLNKGLQEYPDKEFSHETLQRINHLIEFRKQKEIEEQKKRERRQKRKEEKEKRGES